MKYLLLIAGFIVLVYSGKFLIKSSVSLAQRFHISKLVIGLTIVAFGTSAPELFVSVSAILKNHPSIAIGNVIGSNISNIALVLAITALIINIPVKRKTIVFDWPVMMLVSILLYLFILDNLISRFEGIILFILLVGYNIYSIKKSRENPLDDPKNEEVIGNIWLTIFIIILSCGGLQLGSYLLVDNAPKIARELGIDDRIIAITVIAIGTSIPELATSIFAAIKNELDISVGNIIGSNIYNILGVLGVTGMVKPIEILESQTRTFDVLWMLGISFLLFLLMLPIRNSKLTRFKGVLLFCIYGTYIYFLINLKGI